MSLCAEEATASEQCRPLSAVSVPSSLFMPDRINLDYPAAPAPGENSQPKDALNGHTTVVVVYGPLTLTTSHVTPPIGYRGNVEHLATLFQLPSGDFGLSNYINLCAFFPTPTSCV